MYLTQYFVWEQSQGQKMWNFVAILEEMCLQSIEKSLKNFFSVFDNFYGLLDLSLGPIHLLFKYPNMPW